MQLHDLFPVQMCSNHDWSRNIEVHKTLKLACVKSLSHLRSNQMNLTKWWIAKNRIKNAWQTIINYASVFKIATTAIKFSGFLCTLQMASLLSLDWRQIYPIYSDHQNSFFSFTKKKVTLKWDKRKLFNSQATADKHAKSKTM